VKCYRWAHEDFGVEEDYLVCPMCRKSKIVSYIMKYLLPHIRAPFVRGNADKSLVRPGRKQATATKLRIYSTYSQRSSIHFLARCSNFWKPLKKIQNVIRPTRFRGSNDLRVGRKMATFQLFLQSREQVVVRRGQIRRIGWVIKTLEAQVG